MGAGGGLLPYVAYEAGGEAEVQAEGVVDMEEGVILEGGGLEEGAEEPGVH